MLAGISTYTFTWAIGVPGNVPAWPLTEIQLIDLAVKYQVPVVQIADNLPLHKMDGDRLNRLIAYASEKNIQIEVAARGMTPKNLEQYILLAEMFKSPILRFVIDGPSFEPDLDDINSIITNVLPELKKRNIVLAIENHDRLFSWEFEHILKYCNHANLGICLDSVNSLGAGEDVNRVVDVLAPYTVNFHAKEFIISRHAHKMGFTVVGCPLGKGMLQIESILERLDPKKCRSAILEQWTPPEDTLDKTIEKEALWAEESIEALKLAVACWVKQGGECCGRAITGASPTGNSRLSHIG
ncbi:MAG: TIM barrel protein [Bacteroidales bacterium]|nr:TIM barrel protein [Bacteroidales bacterium]